MSEQPFSVSSGGVVGGCSRQLEGRGHEKGRGRCRSEGVQNVQGLSAWHAKELRYLVPGFHAAPVRPQISTAPAGNISSQPKDPVPGHPLTLTAPHSQPLTHLQAGRGVPRCSSAAPSSPQPYWTASPSGRDSGRPPAGQTDPQQLAQHDPTQQEAPAAAAPSCCCF